MDFYKRLNYSLGNEDWSVEEQALRVAPGNRVVCVTASGDRPLHLLMTSCAQIISIDMNHIQTYLLDLKKTAILHLDYDKYLEFLGCEPTHYRLDIFKELKPHLSKESAIFWEQHKKMIHKGVIYQGLVERLTNLGAKFFNLMRHKKNQTLLSFTDINSQREYLKKTWNTPLWQGTFEFLLSSNLSKWILNDPGLNSFVDASIKPGKYIYQRMNDYLNDNLASTSPLLQLVLIGKLLPEAYFPYLTQVGYQKIRLNPERLQYQTTNIIKYLESYNEGEIDCFSLSDIASYMPQEIFERLLQSVHHAAKPGARFCLREFMSKRDIPTELISKFQRNTQLEQKLAKEESNFVYRFMVGEVQK